MNNNILTKDIENKVREIFKRHASACCPADNLKNDEDISGFGINSLTFIKMVVDIEEEFNFSYDNEHLYVALFPTLQSIIDYVQSKINY